MKARTCGIYCIENLVNRKRYVGQSTNIEKRFNQHKISLSKNSHCNSHLQDSWNLYGESGFIFYVVEVCPESNLDALEIFYINAYKTVQNKYGYNVLVGGGGTRGRIVSDETRKKMSKAHRGRIFSKERNRKISISKKGVAKNISTLWREKITIANTGRKISTRKTTSKYLGVSWCSRDERWRVYFRGRNCGSFKNEKDAAKHYDKTCFGYLGDLSKLNFPMAYEKGILHG